MFEWSDTDVLARDAMRAFVAKEIRPHLNALESGELSPYPIARKLFSEFGLHVMAADAVKGMLERERAAMQFGAEPEKKGGGMGAVGAQASMAVAMVAELSGVSIGLLRPWASASGLVRPPSPAAARWPRRNDGCPG